MALITLDNGHDHTKPNTFGPKGLASLNTAIDAALARDEIVAIGVTGKPFILAAGADLTGVPKLTGREQALNLGKIGHGVMRKLVDGGKPSFAFVNGVALGGGLEVALHATYRTVSAAAGMLATPEVFLGLLPGWGGNFLLPNLIGADKAVKVVVENALNQNKMLSGPEAVKFGIGDVLLDSADFLEQSLLLGEQGADRRGHRRAAGDRPRRRLGRGCCPGQGVCRRQGQRCGPGAVPGARADRGGAEDKRPRLAVSRPRTRHSPT